MNLLDRLCPPAGPPAFLLNSLPKSGTHLLSKAMDLLPGIQRAPVHFGQTSAARFEQTAPAATPLVPIGIDWPHLVVLASLHEALKQVKPGHYVTGHIPFSEALAALLTRMEMKSLLMIRDPRDIVVSHARHVSKTTKHFLSDLYRPLSPAERITVSIRGVEPVGDDGPRLLDIAQRCRSVMPWMAQSFNYTTAFEKLVGPQGGGSRTSQRQELEAITNHIGLHLSAAEIEQAAAQVFGGTNTFDRGAIGSWRKEFSPAHRALFKELAGQSLIEWGYEQDLDW